MNVSGTTASGFESFRDAFAKGQADDPGGAQLCVYQDGQVVVDLWTDTDRRNGAPFHADSLTSLRSTTKGLLATCFAILVDRGLVDVDAPVSEYWPGFEKNGKADITTAHVLSHTAGLPYFPSSASLATKDLANRELVLRVLEEAAPLWVPGSTRGAYHAVTVGFLGDEILRRITGSSTAEFLRENVAEPLGLELWIGLPAEEEHRFTRHDPWDRQEELWSPESSGLDHENPVVQEILLGGDAIADLLEYLNTRGSREIVLSSANGTGSARAVARMYAALIGDVDGHRLVSPEALGRSRRSRNRDLPQLVGMEGMPVPEYGLGFALDLPLGSIGHGGAGGVQGFAIPDRGLAVSYTCTSMYQPPRDLKADPRPAAWLAELERL